MFLAIFLVAFAVLQLIFTALVLKTKEPYYPDEMLVDEQIETSLGSIS